MKILKFIISTIFYIFLMISAAFSVFVIIPACLLLPSAWVAKIDTAFKRATLELEIQESKAKKRQHPHLRSRYSHN